jgi:hypothetical protein
MKKLVSKLGLVDLSQWHRLGVRGVKTGQEPQRVQNVEGDEGGELQRAMAVLRSAWGQKDAQARPLTIIRPSRQSKSVWFSMIEPRQPDRSSGHLKVAR